MIRERWPAEMEIAECGSLSELDSVIQRAQDDGFDAVIAVGGDGTVHEVAKRLIDRPMALGVIPTGSGNGFARHLALPIDTRQAIDACAHGRVTTIDTAAVNTHVFLGVMGVGFDAYIAHRFAASTARGFRTYVREGLLAFRRYRPEEYQIEIDGQTLTERAFIVAVANSSQYGNNARIAPDASLRDGLLDLVIIREASIVSTPFLLARLFAGTLRNSPMVGVMRGTRFVIRRGAEGAAHLDGEPIMLPATLDVRVQPATLRVLVPGGDATI